MPRKVLRVALALLLLGAMVQLAFSQDEEKYEFKSEKVFNQKQKGGWGGGPGLPQPNPPPPPNQGPPDVYIYRNNDGVFALGPTWRNGIGRWEDNQGRVHKAVLELHAFGAIQGPAGPGIPAGVNYDVWVYRAFDKNGNVWYFAFGVKPIPPRRGVPPQRYGLFYSLQDPNNGGKFQRWQTPGWTRRE